MSELEIPESWAESSFGDCVSFWTGFAFKSSEYTNQGVFVLRVTNISPNSLIDTKDAAFISENDFDRKYRSFELFEGDVLIVMVGATTGKIGVVSRDVLPAVLNQNMWKLCPNWDLGSSKKFLYYLLKHLQQDVLTGAAGSATGFIKQGEFKQRPLPLPPLGEQRRIVSKIESTFKRIEAIENAVKSAESLITKYRESLLNKAFRGELVPQDPNDESASKLLERIRAERAKQLEGKKKKKDELPPITMEEIPFEIPKSWEWVRLGDLVHLKHGYAFKSENFVKFGKYVLTTPGHFFEGGGFRDQGKKTKFLTVTQKDEFVLKQGDMIVAMTEQAPGLLGSAAWIPNDRQTYLHNQRLGKITPIDSSGIKMEYIYEYFNAPYLRQSLANSCTGSTVRHTSSERILGVLIPLPPLSEQLRIATAIQSHKVQERGLRITLNALVPVSKVLKCSTLEQAFSGRLVPQDPSEGTGHQLLEQILVAKTETDAAQTKSKNVAAKPKPRKPKK